LKKLIPIIASLVALAGASNALAASNTANDACPTDAKQVVGSAALAVTVGGTSTATFTIPAGCPSVQVSLVSYTHTAPFFTWENASDEVVFDQHTLTYGPGAHSISVNTPNCFYQVDLVQGTPIEKLGPADSNNFYSRQFRLVAADNGGTQACVPPPPPPVVTVITVAKITDVCGNIIGNQAKTPKGDVRKNGGCYPIQVKGKKIHKKKKPAVLPYTP
jgi:hypothetical protein